MNKNRLKGKQKRRLKHNAGYIVNRLKEAGFIVQRYNSYSTNSIYLKLDYGVCNSIRISDHKGKKHLSYRYNVLSCCPERIAAKDKWGNIKYYFPLKDSGTMIGAAICDRQKKIAFFGATGYKTVMQKRKEKGMKKKGFWQKAKVV
ncbi:hypothetical protein [Lentibacillus salinarum]|uniref:Uncharacterized protein n=1 Tax=Lentibacillus salinarum TaxID=446820 RepID=A0ABW3ZXQ1_9BACI